MRKGEAITLELDDLCYSGFTRDQTLRPVSAWLPIDTASLADAMSQMRDWLDKRACMPILFATTREQLGTVVIRVEFADGGDAAAFRAAFGQAEPGEGVAAA